MHDLVRFFEVTYGDAMPDDDAGREDFFILAHHVARLNGDPARIVRRYAAQWVTWMSDDELAATVRRVSAKPIKWTAETLGQRLELLNDVRTKLGITTIRPIDVSPEQLERQRRERASVKRRTKSRAEYEDGSLTKAAPWKAEGMSRAKWYRRQKGRETGPRQQCLSVPTHTCLNPRPSLTPSPLARQKEGAAASVLSGAPCQPYRCHQLG